MWGILYTIFMLVAMPIFGINQGVQPIIGYNYGAGRPDRVKQALVTAILAATALTALGFTVAMLFPAEVIRLFNPKDSALLDLGTHAMRISMLGLPLVGFQVVSASYFQAVGKPREAMLLMLSRQLLLLDSGGLDPAAAVRPGRRVGGPAGGRCRGLAGDRPLPAGRTAATGRPRHHAQLGRAGGTP